MHLNRKFILKLYDYLKLTNTKRIEVEELIDAEFVPVFSDTSFLHLFDNDTIKSPYQDGLYAYAIIGGSGTGNNIVSPIFVVVVNTQILRSITSLLLFLEKLMKMPFSYVLKFEKNVVWRLKLKKCY